MLESGEMITIPQEHASDFRIVKTNNPYNVFRMFQNGRFKELYIFGLDLELEEPKDLVVISGMVKEMVRNCKSVYYCTDYEVPPEWAPTMAMIHVITIDEGIELVQK